MRFKIDVASENVRRMKASGVTMLAGTDAPNLGSFGISLHGQLELLMRAGLTPAEALRAATQAPAKAFGLTDRGQIKPGSRADLVLVDGNPLDDIRITRAIVRVFKNGYEVARSIPPASGP